MMEDHDSLLTLNMFAFNFRYLTGPITFLELLYITVGLASLLSMAQLLLSFFFARKCHSRVHLAKDGSFTHGKGTRGYHTLLGKGKGIEFYPRVRVRV
jgi:hypothetical protein